jgi:ribosomal-protein-alanine N-acetyltransferase
MTASFPLPLIGSCVTLRDFIAEDLAGFLEWASDDAMYEYMIFRFATPEAAIAEFERLLHHPSRLDEARRHFYLAVVADNSTEFVGITGFDVHADGSAELGWYLASPFWNQGFATEASSLLLGLGFDVLGLTAIHATCDPENYASRRVLEKSGFRLLVELPGLIETWRGPRRRLDFAIQRSGLNP